ncbi:MAG: phosphodiester glycosidase family protein [Pseudomonadota bacterium]
MKNRHLLCVLPLILAACEQQPEGEPVNRIVLGDAGEPNTVENVPEEPDQQATDLITNSACKESRFEGVPLKHCVADPSEQQIEAYLEPLPGSDRTTVEDAYAAVIDNGELVFMLNGGMVDSDQRPLGYFVQGGDRLAELNRADRDSGNFYLKPNGVFYGSGASWRILTTERFFSTVRDRPAFGTQSGPMLVIEGELHPEIQEDGPSRAIRSAVGVDEDGKAHFVISGEPLSFGRLARYFMDEVEATNALMLSSNRSALFNGQTGQTAKLRPGPVIVVRKRNSDFSL